MRSINITTAISYLPEHLVTEEMLLLAADEHNPKLIQYLPPSYRTADMFNRIFLPEENPDRWVQWDLQEIPEEYRTYKICLRAVEGDVNNLKYVPEALRKDRIVSIATSESSCMAMLPLIPATSWNKKNVTALLWSLSHMFSGNFNNRDILPYLQVALTFIPHKLKRQDLYLRLLEEDILSPNIVHFITPSKYKTRKYYLALAEKDFQLVPQKEFDYELFDTVLYSDPKQTRRLLLDKELSVKLMEYLDDRLADKTVSDYPEGFAMLPEPFQTPERLLLAIHSDLQNDSWGYRFFLDVNKRELLTRKVCEALVRGYCYIPKLPPTIWTSDFVEYCTKHGRSLSWFEQVPRHLITWEVGERVFKDGYNYVSCLPLHYITPERAKLLYRTNPTERKYIPSHYLKGFSSYTGLPEGFFGGEVPLPELKKQRQDYTYCKLSPTTYLGFYTQEPSCTVHRVIMTRAENRYMPAQLVFDKPVFSSFHKTWLEKLVMENDPQFVKPKIDKSLADVQACKYYDVQTLESKDGFEVFRNTFLGQAMCYYSRKDGEICQADTLKELFRELSPQETEKQP